MKDGAVLDWAQDLEKLEDVLFKFADIKPLRPKRKAMKEAKPRIEEKIQRKIRRFKMSEEQAVYRTKARGDIIIGIDPDVDKSGLALLNVSRKTITIADFEFPFPFRLHQGVWEDNKRRRNIFGGCRGGGLAEP